MWWLDNRLPGAEYTAAHSILLATEGGGWWRGRVTGTVGTDSHEIARSVGVFSQTSPLVKYFHSCLMSGEEYEEKEWDSLMELPPHSSKKSGGPPSQTKTQ